MKPDSKLVSSCLHLNQVEWAKKRGHHRTPLRAAGTSWLGRHGPQSHHESKRFCRLGHVSGVLLERSRQFPTLNLTVSRTRKETVAFRSVNPVTVRSFRCKIPGTVEPRGLVLARSTSRCSLAQATSPSRLVTTKILFCFGRGLVVPKS